MQYDCAFDGYFGDYSCPLAVNTISKKPVGHLVLNCPKIGPDEIVPTCFYQEKSKDLTRKILLSKCFNHSLENLERQDCNANQTLTPISASASSFEVDFVGPQYAIDGLTQIVE